MYHVKFQQTSHDNMCRFHRAQNRILAERKKPYSVGKYIRETCFLKKIDRSRVNDLNHLFNFKRSVLRHQISPKHF